MTKIVVLNKLCDTVQFSSWYCANNAPNQAWWFPAFTMHVNENLNIINILKVSN